VLDLPEWYDVIGIVTGSSKGAATTMRAFATAQQLLQRLYVADVKIIEGLSVIELENFLVRPLRN
jgi:hypothetical protein